MAGRWRRGKSSAILARATRYIKALAGAAWMIFDLPRHADIPAARAGARHTMPAEYRAPHIYRAALPDACCARAGTF